MKLGHEKFDLRVYNSNDPRGEYDTADPGKHLGVHRH